MGDNALGMGVWGSQHMTELHLGGSNGRMIQTTSDASIGKQSSGSIDDFVAHGLTDSPISRLPIPGTKIHSNMVISPNTYFSPPSQ